jgi:DtxR family Mn-dependent transcriptional regulator
VRTNSSKSKLSATQEDYLRAIYLLSERDEAVSVTNIAKRLQLSKSTVSERLKELASANLLTQAPYGKVALTTRGAVVGQTVTHKHRIIEVFLHDTLGLPETKVHAEADKLEHALSDEVIRRLAVFLGQPDADPHGSAIPDLPK